MANRVLNILISPLDWGLGHASRCIPIIKYLIHKGHNIIIAASGMSLELLQKNFKTEVTFVQIPGYNVSYANKGNKFTFKILQQIPHIYKTIKSEHKIVQQLVVQHRIDLIISDNRYGVYHSKVPSYFMTHQYQIMSGMNALADFTLLKWHEAQMRNFSGIWIVDEQINELAGRLSHPNSISLENVNYIGHLSQIDIVEVEIKQTLKNILLLLSGPEPARSQLYDLFLAQALQLQQYHFVIITGSNLSLKPTDAAHIIQYGLSDSTLIQNELLNADLVVCRSGYSSIMDLIAVHQKALLIPTPGQTEQVYLAQELKQKDLFEYTKQANLNLQDQLPIAFQYIGFSQNIYTVNNQFQSFIDAVLDRKIY